MHSSSAQLLARHFIHMNVYDSRNARSFTLRRLLLYCCAWLAWFNTRRWAQPKESMPAISTPA